MTALITASNQGHLEVVRALLLAKADPDITDHVSHPRMICDIHVGVAC